MHTGGRLGAAGPALDLLPGLLEGSELPLEHVTVQLRSHRPDDHSAFVAVQQLPRHRPQPGSLGAILDLAADPDVRAERHENEETTREGHLGRYAGSLRADGLLGDLDEELLALRDDVLDGLVATGAPIAVALVLDLGFGQVGGVQEGRFLGCDIDERGL